MWALRVNWIEKRRSCNKITPKTYENVTLMKTSAFPPDQFTDGHSSKQPLTTCNNISEKWGLPQCFQISPITHWVTNLATSQYNSQARLRTSFPSYVQLSYAGNGFLNYMGKNVGVTACLKLYKRTISCVTSHLASHLSNFAFEIFSINISLYWIFSLYSWLSLNKWPVK